MFGLNETVARRIAQNVEAYSGEGGKRRWARVHHYKCHGLYDPIFELPLQRKPREELDLENLRGQFTGVAGTGRQSGPATSAGDGADGEGTLAAKAVGPPETADPRRGGSDAMAVNQASGPGTTAGRIKSLKDGYGVVLDTLFPIPLVRELGPRPHRWRQVRAWLRDKRREEDVNACSGSRAPFAAVSVLTPKKDLVTAGVKELVDRSLPTFAIPEQRVALLKLLRGRGVCDARDGGLSLAIFVLCQKSQCRRPLRDLTALRQL